MKTAISAYKIILITGFAACLCSCMATPELKTGSGVSMELAKAAHLVGLVVLSPDGRYAAVRSSTIVRHVSDTVELWDLASATVVKEFTGLKQDGSVSFSPDGRYLAIGDKGMKIWDISAAKEIKIIGKAGGPISFSADGRQIQVGYTLFDFETGQPIRALKEEFGATSPDGRYSLIVPSAANGTISLRDISTNKIANTSNTQTFPVAGLAFSNDGRNVLLGSGRNITWGTQYGGIAALFDVSTLTEIRRFSAGGWEIPAVNFSPDGKFALTGGSDGYVKIWNIATGLPVRSFKAHLGGHKYYNHGVTSLKISPDGGRIISSGDASVKIWDFATGDLIATFVAFTDGEWIVTTPNGYYNASTKGDQYLQVTVGNKSYTTEQLRESFYRPDLVKLAMTGGSLREFRKLADVKEPPVVTIVNTPVKVDKDEVALTLNISDSGGGVGDIRLYLNGSAVMLDNTRDIKVVSKSGGISRTYTLKLSNGLNTIRAIAFNGDNTMQSSDATCQITASFLGQARPSLYAVVVGINEYKNPKLQLKSAVADAELFARTLKTAASGFFEKVSIKTLTTVEATTSESIINKLKGLRALNPDDLFVFYVASHGTVDDGEYYLIPSNVGSTRTEKLKTDAISQTVFKELIANIPATKKLIVLDTCNSGALGDAIQTAMLTRGMSEDTAMKILGRAVGSTILSAATSVQDAIEGYQGHGLFTYVLAEGLSGKADKGKTGYIKTTDLADYVDSEVPLLAEKVFKKAQYPSISINGQGFPIGKAQ